MLKVVVMVSCHSPSDFFFFNFMVKHPCLSPRHTYIYIFCFQENFFFCIVIVVVVNGIIECYWTIILYISVFSVAVLNKLYIQL